MFEAFMNPWSMAAGAALVSAPVVIHLINRMRFKKVRWAAMEFLLKAQKRMRRKMIVEQLVLLALRCLLVLLLGLLAGRYLGYSSSSKESRATAHVVVLDDSPSMEDFWRGEDGQKTDSFLQARKQLVEQIAPAAAQASTPQTLEVLRLSDLGNPRNFGRLGGDAGREIDGYLSQFRPSSVRVGLAEGLKKAKERLDAEGGKDVARAVHVLSDFRAVDWAQDGEAIKAAFKDLANDRTAVHLVDAAHPYRRNDKKTPPFHDNVGIVELRSKGRVVPKDQPVEFSVRVKNFGNAELKDVRCAILVNGDENRGMSLFVPSLPANQEKDLAFTLQFSQTASEQRPMDRFNLVTARLELAEPGGLTADNVRHAVVEVRDRLSVLVVEGTRPELRDKKEADGFYLKRLFLDSIVGLNWVGGSVRDLESSDLQQYSSVYLLNVPEPTEAATKALEGYVREGGGLGVFLGPSVKPAEYNKWLYKDGKGLFPVPLPDRPTDPLPFEERMKRQYGSALSKKFLLSDPSVKQHRAVESMYRDQQGNPIKDDDLEKFFNFVWFDRYWPVKRLGNWREDPAVKELYCLPNDQPMGNYEAGLVALLNRLRERIKQPKYQSYRPYLDRERPEAEAGAKPERPLLDRVREKAAQSEPLTALSALLDRLLCDQGTVGDPSEPVLREFWSLPELADLKRDFARLRDAVKFGDPLYLAKQYGMGRVTALLTTAGEAWNDWPSGPARPSWVVIVSEMQKYLAGGGGDANRATGSNLRLTFDAARYKPLARRTFLSFDEKDKAPAPGQSAVKATDLGEQALTPEGGRLVLSYDDATRPGAYVFALTRVKGQDGKTEAGERTEYAAYAFNVDAAREGDLRRANRDDIAQIADKVPIHSADDPKWTDELKQHPSDLSSTRWLYLILLVVLVVEQAMAVRLSYHAHAGEMEAHAPTAAAALHRIGATAGAAADGRETAAP